MNLFEKMLEAEKRIGVVAKNLNVSAGNGTYKAVSERDIIDAVKPVEAELGIYSFPYAREIVESDMLEAIREYKGQTTKTVSKYLRLKITYRFVNVENPEEFIDMVTFADGIDTGDKATGKAMTYADKYALMKAYKISTGDDPDQYASEPNGYQKAEKKPTLHQLTDFALGYSEEERQKIRDYFKVKDDMDLSQDVVKGYIAKRKDIIADQRKINDREIEKQLKGEAPAFY